MYSTSSPAPKGFTLIELLVVIAIIGLLSSIVLASLTAARERAQDARRYSDLRQVSTALELYRNDHSAFPISGSLSDARSYVSSLSDELTPQYIGDMPEDPTNTNVQAYRYCSNGSSYTLAAYTTEAPAGTTNRWCHMSNGANVCGGAVLSAARRCGE